MSMFNVTDISEAHGTILGILSKQTTKNVFLIMVRWILSSLSCSLYHSGHRII